MKRKKLILNDYRIIVDEINYYYAKNVAVKNQTEMTYRLYIEFTNREMLMLKFPSADERDYALRTMDEEFE